MERGVGFSSTSLVEQRKTQGPGLVSGELVDELTYEYSPTYDVVHWTRVTRNATDPANRSVRIACTDSLGMPLESSTQADPGAGDGAAWIVRPAALRSNQGEPLEWYRPYFSNREPTACASGPGGPPIATAIYDFMSRRTLATTLRRNPYRPGGVEGHELERRTYHPLSVDRWDAENLQSTSSHFDAYSTAYFDGHGRRVRTDKLTDGGVIQATRTDYLATGELVALARYEGFQRKYVRWMRYDSLGRVVESAEPNTALGFVNDPPAVGPSGMKAWRYAYDNNGQLVGTRDARGCGKNLTYDYAGRMLSEDYSPCLSSHAAGCPLSCPYTAALTNGDNPEVFYWYDSPEPGQTTDYGDNLTALVGKLVSVRDRGAHTRFAYDAKGQMIGVARRIAKPGTPAGALSNRYTAHWFRTATSFDEVGRVKQQSTGADVPELFTTEADFLWPFPLTGNSVTNYHYTRRDLVASIDGSYGTLLQAQRFAADGAPEMKRFGDVSGTEAAYTYYPDRRVQTYTLRQEGVPIWETPLALVDHTFHYDFIGNITTIDDGRPASAWPDGAKPAKRTMVYDSNYRLTHVDYIHGDIQISPFSAEEAAGNARPFPRIVFPGRTRNQSYSYDAIGNIKQADEDTLTSSFDRGLGAVTNGHADGSKPNQLLFANGPSTSGAVEAHYDDAGNLVDIALERDGECSAPTAKCAQRFLYEWDEVGQLARARRWDFTSLTGQPVYPTAPAGLASVELEYQYSQGQRVTKKAVDPTAGDTFTVDVFPSLRLNHATYDGATNEFERTAETETVYVAGLARVVYAPGLSSAGSDLHVFFGRGPLGLGQRRRRQGDEPGCRVLDVLGIWRGRLRLPP